MSIYIPAYMYINSHICIHPHALVCASVHAPIRTPLCVLHASLRKGGRSGSGWRRWRWQAGKRQYAASTEMEGDGVLPAGPELDKWHTAG